MSEALGLAGLGGGEDVGRLVAADPAVDLEFVAYLAAEKGVDGEVERTGYRGLL